MNKNQALREARKRWGNSGATHDLGRSRASTPERRAAASAQLREHFAAKPLGTPREKWATLSLEVRTEIVRLVREWEAERNRLSGEARRMRYKVGRIVFMGAFMIEGSGDSWAEAFAEVDARAARDREQFAEARAKLKAAKKRKPSHGAQRT